ncbi:MAG: 30S ribosomal protein S2 [Candidatus Magasanikbacteria bacterium]|nr:30S ribosomal protein S2 [Candidatus Magasanikbacteria bacterium]
MQIPSLEEMFAAGVHFGHRSERWHPKSKPFIFGERQGIHVVNLEVTQEKLAEACEFAKKLAAEGKTILFLGTKRQAQQVIKTEAERCGMPYNIEGWLGGLITNFDELGKLLERYRKMRTDREAGAWEKYTKKERSVMEVDYQKKRVVLEGLSTLKKMPDAIYIVDIRNEKTAVTEAGVRGIPSIAITDTNVNPEKVTHPIPANDDAVRSIALITRCIADAILEGKAARTAAAPVEENKPAAAPRNSDRAMVAAQQ